MSLAVVRSIGSPRQLSTAQDVEDFEQELVDQYALARVGAGVTDRFVVAERSAIVEFVRFLGRPVWTTSPADADRFLVHASPAGRPVTGVDGKQYPPRPGTAERFRGLGRQADGRRARRRAHRPQPAGDVAVGDRGPTPPRSWLRLPAKEREETVRSLRAAGLSTRAIASATGMSKDTSIARCELSQMRHLNRGPGDRRGRRAAPAPASAAEPFC